MKFLMYLTVLEVAMAAATGLKGGSEPKIRDIVTGNAAPSLEVRDEPTNEHSIHCKVGEKADAYKIHNEQVPTIERAGDHVLGEKSCRRLACSWNSAVFLCNDSRHEIRIPGRIIGDNVRSIARYCQTGTHPYEYIYGEIWSLDYTWKVVVRADPC
ncbi:hypothetical protein QBC34DRAFT_379172 [Podospora aff. communis PSN243]|uniref:Avirulence Effector AvrLm4-7 domain-containing protein n=1 Tax=Podospora aff. communis PSN243 TaxID=3040156 RepID=A0AAV9GR86_9PEZI|nr:hypothetical protein QBC34DRAFT_379172 [Podospora aff. communis PSN243]